MTSGLKVKEKVSQILRKYSVTLVSLVVLVLLIWGGFETYFYNSSKQNLSKQLSIQKKQLNQLLGRDEYKINKKQEEEIGQIKTEYKKSIDLYDQIQDLKAQKQDTSNLDKQYAQVVEYLSQINYSSADATLKDLAKGINDENSKIAVQTPGSNSSSQTPAVTSNTPPSNGLSNQAVTSDVGTFNVVLIAGDLSSTRVIVDTASDSDCSNNCPVLSLGDYAGRNNAYAAINGSYFCPPDYAECAGKVNSFDTLLMNKNKHYFNSDNNKYSTVPLVYSSGSGFGVRGQTLDWGRDTNVDMVLAMQPLLVQNGNIAYGGSDIGKYNARGVRSFIANKGSTVYIGEVFSATMGEGAHVLKALGMDNALNLDEGGSTALWFNGSYVSGPGRNLPNAVLFLHK